MLAAIDTFAVDPGMSKRALHDEQRAKKASAKKNTEKRLHHAQLLQQQGQDGAAGIWSKAIQMLPPEVKFSLNAVQDTLPHNANLAKWRTKEGLSSSCTLCGEKHDAVLECITCFITNHLHFLADHLQF